MRHASSATRRAQTIKMSGAKKNLAGYKIPRYIAFPELLKTLTRKFQKLKLREVAKRM